MNSTNRTAAGPLPMAIPRIIHRKKLESEMERQRVSCVIPTHRRPHYLRNAIDSVLGQHQLADCLEEIIVVSDDREPSTAAVAASYDDAEVPVRFVQSPRAHGGASSSRNTGAALATGAYIAFLDDDDFWEPGYLSKALETLSPPRPIFFSSAVNVDDEGRPLGEQMLSADKLTRRHAFVAGSVVTGSNVVLSRTLFEELGGYDTQLPVLNDTDFFVRLLALEASFAWTQSPLVSIRKHDSGQLTNATARRANGMAVFYAKHRAGMNLVERRGFRFRMYGMHRLSSVSSLRRGMFALRQAIFMDPKRIVARMRRAR